VHSQIFCCNYLILSYSCNSQWAAILVNSTCIWDPINDYYPDFVYQADERNDGGEDGVEVDVVHSIIERVGSQFSRNYLQKNPIKNEK